MTRADLVDKISRLLSVTKVQSEILVGTIFDTMTEALVQGDKVELRGFGSFRLRHRKPRTGRNPRTGASVDVPPKRAPIFRVGRQLRQLVDS